MALLCSLATVGRAAFAALPGRWLKRDVVCRCGSRRIRVLAQEADLTSHDFGPVALAAAVFRFVLAGSQPAFDVHRAALTHEPLTNLGQSSEGNDAMPFSAVLFGAVPISEALSGRQRETRHVLP